MKRLMVLASLCGCLAALGADSPWKFQWPAVIPAVAEKSVEATVPVRLDGDLAVEVTCGDGAKGADWVAAKMSAWFGGFAFRATDKAGGLMSMPLFFTQVRFQGIIDQ